jgi:hypothetical protein
MRCNLFDLWRFSFTQGEKKLVNLKYEEACERCKELTPPFRVRVQWIDEQGTGEVKAVFDGSYDSLDAWIQGNVDLSTRSGEKDIKITIGKVE